MQRSHIMRRFGFAAAAALCLGLTGCYLDPFQNPGDWSMSGAAREDTAVQVANKDDLLAGRSEPGSQGGAAGTAAGLQKPPKDITFSSGTGN
jgi:hypothetical protein